MTQKLWSLLKLESGHSFQDSGKGKECGLTLRRNTPQGKLELKAIGGEQIGGIAAGEETSQLDLGSQRLERFLFKMSHWSVCSVCTGKFIEAASRLHLLALSWERNTS